MTRQIPAYARALLLLCAILLFGSALAQAPLELPPPPEPAPAPESTAEPMPDEGQEAEPQPTVEPQVAIDDGLRRFDPTNPEPPISLETARDVPSRVSFDAAKVEFTLGEMLGQYVLGQFDVSEQTARNYWLPRDKRDRFLVVLWAADGVKSKQVAQLVKTAGGAVQRREGKSVYAKLTAQQIAVLSQQAIIASIEPRAVGRVEPEATSAVGGGRNPVGPTATEGFDVANALMWHNAGNHGDNVNIGIIDFGFGPGGSAGPELTCLNSHPNINLSFGGTPSANDTRRGLDMAEVICDIAPQSRVRLYKVTTSDNLHDAINAADNNNDIIVIGAEFGVNFSPGDGTFGRNSGKDVYEALANAKAAGVTVLAAAGNSHQAYSTFTYSGSGTVTLAIEAKPGDQINVSWNDWNFNTNDGGAREDLNITLTGAGVNVGNSPRPTGGNPVRQINVPGNCTVTGEFCLLTLSVNSLSGNASTVIVQVNVSGGVDRKITSVTGAPQVWDDAGTLSRPADSPDVITVGAVCVDYTHNFPREGYSGKGPVYSAGGAITAIPTGIMKAREVKPDIVGPSAVSVANQNVGILDNCDSGFRGTQASAAHAAGIAALLLNNSLVSGFNGVAAPANLLHYFRTHSVDLPLSTEAAGYDMAYGAGLAVLGAPDYDYDTMLNAPAHAAPNRIPPGECTAGIRYVGPRNAGSDFIDGTLDHPFQSIMHAFNLQAEEAGRCVVVLPGEYVTPFLLTSDSHVAGVYAYSAVTLQSGVVPTTLVVQNKYWGEATGIYQRRAALYIADSASPFNFAISGFRFKSAGVYNDAEFRQPQLIAVDSVQNATISGMTMNGFTSNMTLVEIFNSYNVLFRDNTFKNNRALAGASIFAISHSGLSTSRIVLRDNHFEGNEAMQSVWDVELHPSASVPTHSIPWVPIIRSLESYTDLINNVLVGNTAESMIQGVTRLKSDPHELRLLGNAIVGNTMDTDDLGLSSGPLVHAFFHPRVMAVNNTIAQNQFLNSGAPNNVIFGRGDDIPNNGFGPGGFDTCETCGSQAGAFARWDLRGNLIASNGSSQIARDLDLEFAGHVLCEGFDGEGGHTGAQYNWIFASGTGGDCQGSLGSPISPNHNNVLDVDPFEDVLGSVFPELSPMQPEYWAPLGEGDSGPSLVDTGPHGYVMTAELSFFGDGADLRGDGRINNTIDIGAYEYTTFELEPVISANGIEDGGVIEFDLNEPVYLQGGFPPFTATVQLRPAYYGTHCDTRFASHAAQGAAVEMIDADTLTVAYCPPRDFHTETDDATFVGSGGLFMTLVVRDAAGNTDTTTIEYTITPVNDSALATPLVTTSAVGLGRATANNPVRMRPYVDFTPDPNLGGSNFRFSEAGNGAHASQIDYDFVYPSLPTLISGSSQIGDNLHWIDQSRGIFGINLTGVNTPVNATLQYTVTDANGHSVLNTITINAVHPPGPFNHLQPTEDFIIANLDAFSGFTWEASTNATTYDFLIARRVNPPYIEVLKLTGLTPEVDGDALSCPSTCTLLLTPAHKQVLVGGGYRWVVTADNGGLKVTAANAPSEFEVEAGRELIINGGFEEAGATGKLAANWKLKKGTKDIRKCDGGDGNSLCLFQFTAKKGTKATLVQKHDGIGRRGDVLTLASSIRTQNLSANTGVLIVKVKYMTGDSDKITLNAPGGTNDFATISAPPLTLRFPVKKIVTKLQIKPGKGKMLLDNVSMSIDEKADFELLTPGDNDTIIADAGYLTELTWQSSGLAASYNVLLMRIVPGNDPTLVIDDEYTAVPDGDSVACASGACTLDLGTSLADGDYLWSVTASNGVIASNAPFMFKVDASNQDELLVNGGFEVKVKKKKLPKDWKVKNGKSSALVCESGIQHPEYQGACAFQFAGVGGAKAKLTQKVPTGSLAIGDRLTLRIAAQMNKTNASGDAKLTVKYNDGSKAVTRKITLPSNSREWTAYAADSVTLTKNVKKVTVAISYKGGGRLVVDNVSLTRETDE